MQNYSKNMAEKKTMNIRLLLSEWEFLNLRSDKEHMSINSIIREYIKKDMKRSKKSVDI